MRIVICAAFYPPYKGGYAESVRLLAEGFAAQGHSVTVIACDRRSSTETDIGGVSVRRVRSWNPLFLHGSFPIPDPIDFWRALRAAYRNKISLISTHTRFFPSTILGFIFGIFYGIPIFHTERGAGHSHSDSFYIRVIGYVVDQIAGRFVYSFSRGVIAVSDASKKFTRRLGAVDSITIYNGINVKEWESLYSRKAGVKGSIRIVFIGRLVYAKGIHDLIAAFSELRGEFPGALLSIVGEGPYEVMLRRYTSSLGLSDAVLFHGALDSKGLRAMLHESDVFANPSHTEGFPRSVLEAAAAGLPIVATDVGGTREIIEHRKSGILIPAKNISALVSALTELAHDAELRDRLGNEAARRSRSFSVEQMINSYEAYFTAHGVL